MKNISYDDYKFLSPFNEKYAKWLDDKITTMKIFTPYSHLFENHISHSYFRDNELFTIKSKSSTIDNILENNGIVVTNSTFSDRLIITKKNNKFYRRNYFASKDSYNENTSSSLNDIIEYESLVNLNWKTDIKIIYENEDRIILSENQFCRIYLLNENGDNPIIGNLLLFTVIPENENFILSCEEIDVKQLFSDHEINELFSLCTYIPKVEFFAIDVIFTKSGVKIIEMHSNPPYIKNNINFSQEINNYLYKNLESKKKFFLTNEDNDYSKTKLLYNEVINNYPKGFYPFRKSNLTLEMIPNFNDNLLKSDWQLSRGFLPHRIEQYGINDSNNEKFISDFEYAYLGHVNNSFRCWFEDKITIKYILRDYHDCLPEYYYLISYRNGKNRIIKLMDCPEDYNTNFDDIFSLLEEKLILALKPDEGTHGAGFIKLTLVNDCYFVNDELISKEEIINILKDKDNQYIITEFIQQHEVLNKIYPGAVNTVRMTVFKKDGITPVIGNCYIRFGSNETNGVDNISAGGLGADVDVETGAFGNAVNRFKVSTPYHPDTGVLIEGILPNWEYAKASVINIANSLKEIEYMGFDVAFTPTGIKLPEINRMPDFPMLNKVTEKTLDYLLHKLDQKKIKYLYK